MALSTDSCQKRELVLAPSIFPPTARLVARTVTLETEGAVQRRCKSVVYQFAAGENQKPVLVE